MATDFVMAGARWHGGAAILVIVSACVLVMAGITVWSDGLVAVAGAVG